MKLTFYFAFRSQLRRLHVPLHGPRVAGRGASFRPLQQHGRAAAVQVVPSAGRAPHGGGGRQRRRAATLLQRLPLHPAQLLPHRVPAG